MQQGENFMQQGENNMQQSENHLREGVFDYLEDAEVVLNFNHLNWLDIGRTMLDLFMQTNSSRAILECKQFVTGLKSSYEEYEKAPQSKNITTNVKSTIEQGPSTSTIEQGPSTMLTQPKTNILKRIPNLFAEWVR